MLKSNWHFRNILKAGESIPWHSLLIIGSISWRTLPPAENDPTHLRGGVFLIDAFYCFRYHIWHLTFFSKKGSYGQKGSGRFVLGSGDLRSCPFVRTGCLC